MHNINTVKLITFAKLGLKYPKTSYNTMTDYVRKTLFNQPTTPFPRLITLYATNRCNLNCPMCLNAIYRKNNIRLKDIDLKLINRILPELIINKPFIYITGGEPLLNKDIFKIIKLLSSNKIFTSLTTNGFVLEQKAEEIIDSGLEFISLSLDHFQESKHDKGRGVATSYQRLVNGLIKLIKLRKTTPSNIKINTVIRKDNYNMLSKMYDFIERLGIDEWSLEHYSFITPKAAKSINNFSNSNIKGNLVVGTPINNSYFLNVKQTTILKKQLYGIGEKSKKYHTKLAINPFIDNLTSYYQGLFPTKKSYCDVPFECMNIMEGSKVTLCLGNEIGNLKSNKSIKDIWMSDKAKIFRKLISKEKILPPCFRCCALNYYFNI